MTLVLLFMDMEFPSGRGTQVEKSWKFQQMVGSTVKPPIMENRGGGSQTGKKTPWGIWTFSGTTH